MGHQEKKKKKKRSMCILKNKELQGPRWNKEGEDESQQVILKKKILKLLIKKSQHSLVQEDCEFKASQGYMLSSGVA